VTSPLQRVSRLSTFVITYQIDTDIRLLRLRLRLNITRTLSHPKHSQTKTKMPPRKRPASETYEADGGFVEDAPKSKKSKALPSGPKSKNGGARKEETESEYWEVGFNSSNRYLRSKSELTASSTM